MADESVPYWRLISILFSSFPLTPGLAFRLHKSAYELYRSDGGVAAIGREDDAVSGEVRNLKRTALLGTLSGPAFEARLDTERGEGIVRFLLTHQGIELMASQETRSPN
ncbi:MAG TPA: hypothetical protein VK698_04290 [Kofleriaceae bacterium]|nr:hypothetical protein [Kofleriaceae bacterium]